MKSIYSFLLLVMLCLYSWASVAQEKDTAEAGQTEQADAAEVETGKSEQKAPNELYLAAKDGRLNKIKNLIASGADVNANNGQGRTALMGAVYYRNRKIIMELLIEGADVNAKDNNGRTALMMAVTTGDQEIVKLLLDAGADPKIEDEQKTTALTIVERMKDKKLRKLLESYES